MADHTITGNQIAWHGTVGNDEVETVTVDVSGTLEVISVDGGGDVHYTLNGSTPTIGGANTWIIPAGAIGSDDRHPLAYGPRVVKLIASAPTRVSVQRG